MIIWSLISFVLKQTKKTDSCCCNVFQWAVVGVTGMTGDNVVLIVEMDSKNAHAPAPILLRPVVGSNVQDLPKRQEPVITDHAQVQDTCQLDAL